MLYKRKQIYWIDGFIGGKRVKSCTGFKDKSRALKLYYDLMEKDMIRKRLGLKFYQNFYLVIFQLDLFSASETNIEQAVFSMQAQATH